MIGRMEKIKRRDDKDEKRMGDIFFPVSFVKLGGQSGELIISTLLVSSWLKIQKREEFLFHL